MNKRFSIILFGFAASAAVSAQRGWTMDSCISYALEHATEVRRQLAEQRQTRTDYRTALLDFLPSVSAGVSGQYSWGRNIDPETNMYNNVTTFNNYYSVGASMPVFDGGRTWNAFRQARLAKNKAQTAVQKAQDDKAIDVMGKFVDAVYAVKSIGLMAEKLADSQALLAKTRRLYELGEKSRPDVVQMESQVAEDDYNLLHQQNLARTALLALKSAMNYPLGDTLAVDTILLFNNVETIVPVEIDEQALQSKPAMTMAMADVENARLAWLIQRGSLMPSLTLNGGVSTNYYKNLSMPEGAQSFKSQFSNNLGEYVSLTLSIPLFAPSGWRSMKRAKTSYVLAKLDAEDARRQLNADARNALLDYEGSRKELAQMERKAASDSLAYHLSYRKYEEGMLSTFDLHEAAQTCLESSVKLLQLRMTVAIRLRLVKFYLNDEPLWILN